MTRVAGLLLAAGAGRRMGGPKALVAGADGMPWVVRSARVLAAGGCQTVTVVVGAVADRVREVLRDEPVTVVEAADWASGMGASLRAGLQSLAEDPAEAALVHLVDLPDVGADVIARLLAEASVEGLARPWYGHGPDATPGHPVVIGRAHWEQIVAECAGDAGARAYLSRHDVVRVDCADLAGGADVDAPGGADVDAPGGYGEVTV